MIVTIRLGELVRTIDFSPKEAGELRMTAGGKYKLAIDDFLMEFFTAGKTEDKQDKGVPFPIVNGSLMDKRIGKIYIEDLSWIFEKPFHIEPLIKKHQDGTVTLEALSIVEDK